MRHKIKEQIQLFAICGRVPFANMQYSKNTLHYTHQNIFVTKRHNSFHAIHKFAIT